MDVAAGEFANVVVTKPWGYEYLMYENAHVGVWFLRIDPGQRTSMHCHPRKKSGLILLNGRARMSFLNDSVDLEPIMKVMLRPGLFHSTAAISESGISVIEVETPPMKSDLVRFEDVYAREMLPYEGAGALLPMPDSCVTLRDPVEGAIFSVTTSNCLLTIERISGTAAITNRTPGETVIVLDGGLFGQAGEPVLSHGDIVSTDTLARLAGTFTPSPTMTLLTVKRSSISD